MNEIVKYNNYMNSLKFTGFTTVDFDFLMFLCSKLRDKTMEEVTISFEELRTKTGYTRTSIQKFSTDLERMNEKLMKITCRLQTESEILMFVLFPTFKINLVTQTLTVRVNGDFKFILSDLVKNFTRFELSEFTTLQSKYSKTLFRLLKQFKSTGRLEISLSDFRVKLDCPVAYTTKQFMQNIITPAIKELQNHFQNLRCTSQHERKRGNPVVGYIFTFTPEKKSENREVPRKGIQSKNAFNNFPQNSYDFEKLERELLDN